MHLLLCIQTCIPRGFTRDLPIHRRLLNTTPCSSKVSDDCRLRNSWRFQAVASSSEELEHGSYWSFIAAVVDKICEEIMLSMLSSRCPQSRVPTPSELTTSYGQGFPSSFLNAFRRSFQMLVFEFVSQTMMPSSLVGLYQLDPFLQVRTWGKGSWNEGAVSQRRLQARYGESSTSWELYGKVSQNAVTETLIPPTIYLHVDFAARRVPESRECVHNTACRGNASIHNCMHD
jgi:hypothetical protein